ncbi:MAG: acylphosphatase [Actinobacteria bacterium]|nr:acylphosphatase [Actinomycetota bacterium]
MGGAGRPEHAEVLRARVLVSGRVQGVFFRAAARAQASAAGVAGSATNLPDGRVEAVFQGPREAVERMIDWCRQGPPAARVDSIDISWEPVDLSASGFDRA